LAVGGRRLPQRWCATAACHRWSAFSAHAAILGICRHWMARSMTGSARRPHMHSVTNHLHRRRHRPTHDGPRGNLSFDRRRAAILHLAAALASAVGGQNKGPEALGLIDGRCGMGQCGIGHALGWRALPSTRRIDLRPVHVPNATVVTERPECHQLHLCKGDRLL
jgi:hypothetical protein